MDTGSAVVYYKTIGRGRPLLLLHGGPGSTHDYFLPWVLPLARDRQLVLIDERGSGKSQRLEDHGQYNLETMASDVEAVRVALGLGQIDLRPVPLGLLHGHRGARRLEIGLGLAHAMLVGFGRDLGDQLAGLHGAVEVDEDFAELPRDLRADLHGHDRVERAGGGYRRGDRSALDGGELVARRIRVRDVSSNRRTFGRKPPVPLRPDCE